MIEEIEKMRCKLCNQKFIPKRDWQKFCCSAHQKQYWKEICFDKVYISKRLKVIEERLNLKEKKEG